MNKSNKELDEDLAGDVGSILADFEQSGDEEKAVKEIFDLVSKAEERGAKKMIAINRLIRKHREELKDLGL